MCESLPETVEDTTPPEAFVVSICRVMDVMPLIEQARKKLPEYVDAIFVLKYHMRSILESMKAMIMKRES